MEVARLDIQIRSNEAVASANNVDQALTKLSQTAKRTVSPISGTFDKLKTSIFSAKGLVLGLVGGLGVEKLIEYSSAWEDINSRVRLAADSHAKVGDVMQKLQKIADRNYSSFESVAETYLRNASTLNALGVSTQKQIDLTEAVADAMTVSGAKGQRADIVMQAFARSMANGSLQGEDLNTIIQQGGRLAEALAAGLGKPVTALRAMGKEGKLTSQVMQDSLLSQLDKLGKEADSMPATVGDAFTRMKNQIMATVGALSRDSGLNTAFVGIIDKVTVAIRDLTPVLVNVARAITGTLDPSDEMSDDMKSLATGVNVAIGVFTGIVKLVVGSVIPMWKMLKAELGMIAGIVIELGGLWWDTMKAMASIVSNFVKAAVGNFKALGTVIAGVLTLNPEKIKQGLAEAQSATKNAVTNIAAANKSAMESAKGHMANLVGVLKQGTSDYTEGAKALVQNASDVISTTAENTARKVEQIWDPTQRMKQDRTEEMGQGTIGTPPKPTVGEDSAKKAKEAADANKELADSLSQLRGQYDSVYSAQKDLAEGLKTLDEAQAKGLISAEDRVKVEGQMRRALEDALDPMGAMNREMDEQIGLLKMSAEAREVETELIAKKKELTSAGLAVGEAELEQMREHIQLLQKENKLSQEKDRLMQDSMKGRSDAAGTTMEAIQGLLKDKSSGYTGKDAVSAMQGIFGVDVKDMRSDMDDRLKALEDYYDAVNSLRDKDAAFAQAAADAQQAIELQKRAMMEDSLDRLGAIQGIGQTMMQSNNKKVFAAGKSLALAGAVINGISSAMKSFDNGGGYPWGLIPMALSIATTAAQIAQIRSTQMPGFRTGGEMIVGGSGGPDSQFVGMRVTPGERISINTPSQASAMQDIARMMKHGGAGRRGNLTLNQTIVQQGRPDNKTPDQNARASGKATRKAIRSSRSLGG